MYVCPVFFLFFFGRGRGGENFLINQRDILLCSQVSHSLVLPVTAISVFYEISHNDLLTKDFQRLLDSSSFHLNNMAAYTSKSFASLFQMTEGCWKFPHH